MYSGKDDLLHGAISSGDSTAISAGNDVQISGNSPVYAHEVTINNDTRSRKLTPELEVLIHIVNRKDNQYNVTMELIDYLKKFPDLA